ncbi:DUF4176 domain-containing protein [uncultured Parolsenella sp.]|uniref:DUF4176 domain-containing protein n=1 Tax=uncultured Parolsenella sp. TaxID=2083008 RepID=UPI0027D993BE|nr:DUF4176 domain-containing protein [uncultured Parolsenella sp.]
MIRTRDWLPMGTVVITNEGQHQVMIAGVMVTDGNTGKVWDYSGYPFPEGRGADGDQFFNRSDVSEIYQLGFMNSTGCAFQAYLEERTPEYEELKEKTREGAL